MDGFIAWGILVPWIVGRADTCPIRADVINKESPTVASDGGSNFEGPHSGVEREWERSYNTLWMPRGGWSDMGIVFTRRVAR